jgi:beta-glucosidase
VIEATVTIKNVGKVAGREAVCVFGCPSLLLNHSHFSARQIYVRDLVSRLIRPVKELKGFAKTSLIEPGGSDTVKIALDCYAFAYFDDWAGEGRDGEGRWVAEAGEFEVIAAASSVDERARAGISLERSFDWI